MRKITNEQLVRELSKPGVVIVGLMALTDAKARKTGNPFGEIFKQIKTAGFVGADYQSAVNREASRQGGTENFESEKLPWGTWLIKNKVIQHNGALYLRTQTTPGQRRTVPARLIAYRDAQGKFISKDEARKFIPDAVESDKQQRTTGIKATVWVRTYKFSSILKIRVNGMTYVMEN